MSVPPFTMTSPESGVEDVFERRAAQDALAERGHDLTGIDNRLHGEAVLGAGNRGSRRCSPVPRRRGGASDSRSWPSSEPFGEGPLRAPWVELKYSKNRQTFLEVRDDRRLDDFARRLGQ